MDKHQLKLERELNNKQHNMLIHGFLIAIREYVLDFGLIGTAAYVIKNSGIDKEDLIRCQLEYKCENEMMLAVIEKAFSPEEKKAAAGLVRNSITTLDQLTRGDRFYKLEDRKKNVLAVLEINSISHSIVKSVDVCPSRQFPKNFNARRIYKPKECEVVFLRHDDEIGIV